MNIRKISNKLTHPAIIALLCILINHIYMHLCVKGDVQLNILWTYRAFTFVLFDIFSILILFEIITGLRRHRLAFTLTWAFWLIIDIANIVYSRFFHQYLSLGSISEASNLNGMWWTQYVSSSFHISDIMIIITSVLFIWNICKPAECLKGKFPLKKCVSVFFAVIITHAAISDTLRLIKKTFPQSLPAYLSDTQGNEFHRKAIFEQSLYFCSYGLLRTQIYFAFFYPSTNRKLTTDDINEIKRYVYNHDASLLPVTPDSFHLPGHYNVVFIIVESFMSHTSDLTVNGIEVTPNLNRLRHSAQTYFNSRVKCNRMLGESSDAQLIYFTGLLPLIGDITVSDIATKTLPSLPSLMKTQKGFHTYMTIPTKKHVWHQDEVNRIYGIDNLYSSVQDTSLFLDEDDNLFNFAITNESNMQQPYLHVILTASMHSPYDHTKPSLANVPLRFPPHFPPQYSNYLRSCWFTDKCIGRYISSLKQRHLYDNTIIIITSDHESHPELLQMPASKLSNCSLPLYIINAGIQPTATSLRNIEQIDLYPTLLDLFSLQSTWKGLGNSVFRPVAPSHKSDPQRRARISDKIIRGNYFAQPQSLTR